MQGSLGGRRGRRRWCIGNPLRLGDWRNLRLDGQGIRNYASYSRRCCDLCFNSHLCRHGFIHRSSFCWIHRRNTYRFLHLFRRRSWIWFTCTDVRAHLWLARNRFACGWILQYLVHTNPLCRRRRHGRRWSLHALVDEEDNYHRII